MTFHLESKEQISVQLNSNSENDFLMRIKFKLIFLLSNHFHSGHNVPACTQQQWPWLWQSPYNVQCRPSIICSTDIAKSTGPPSLTRKNSGAPMKTCIVTVQMSSKEITAWSPSIGNLMLKNQVLQNFWRTSKIWIFHLFTSPPVQYRSNSFRMFGSNKQKKSSSLGCPVGYITVYIYFNDLSAKIIVQWLQWNKVQYKSIENQFIIIYSWHGWTSTLIKGYV